MSEYQTISQIMQAAVSPVFLLAGVGALLNVLSGRLGRIIDRLRFLQRYIDDLCSLMGIKVTARQTWRIIA